MDIELTRTLIYFAVIGAVIIIGVYGTSINQLLGIRLRRPKFQLKDKSDIPDYLLKVYQNAINNLTSLGFEYHHSQVSHDLIAHEYAEKYTIVMVNRKTRVFADISPATSLIDLPGYEIDFWSIANNANVLITLNGRGHTLLCGIPSAEVHDPMTANLADTYQAHTTVQTEVFGDKPLIIVNAATYVKLQQKIMDGYFLSLLNEGGLVTTGNNLFRLTFKKARSLANQILKGNSKRNKLNREILLAKRQQIKQSTNQSNTSSEFTDIDVEAEAHAYQRLLSSQKRTPGGTTSKILIFALTLALSYVAFGMVFSFNSVFILLGVILFHELGHIAAMYLFKYRDLQILFIPLLGAAATGSKNEAAIWKQVIVYLMGPLPGIALGIFLITLYQQYKIPWLYETSVTMLLINYLNLLPFVPLDGGHVIRLTIMERFPTGKLIFSGLSALAFAAGGWYLGQPVFWVLAVAMLVSLPWSALEAGVLYELFQQPSQFDQLNKDQKLLKIFETLKQPKFKNLQFIQKFKLVRTVSEVVLHSNHLSRMSSLGLNGLYLSALLLTPPAVLVSMVGYNNALNFVDLIHGKTPQHDWDAEIENQTSSEKRFDVMLHAAQYFTGSKEFNKAQHYLEEAERTFSLINTDNSLAKLYHNYSVFYQGKNDLTQAEIYMGKVINLYRQLPKLNAYHLATSYQAMAYLHRKMEKREDFETDLKAGFSYALKIQKPEQRYEITAFASQILDVFAEKNDTGGAIKLLQDTIPDLLQYSDPATNIVTSNLYQELGWLLVKQGDNNQATEQFEHALALIAYKSTQSDNTQENTLEMANIHLALAMTQYNTGNFSISHDHIADADRIIKLNQFTSLDQYLKEIADDSDKSTRNSAHWSLITKAVGKIAPNFLQAKTTESTTNVNTDMKSAITSTAAISNKKDDTKNNAQPGNSNITENSSKKPSENTGASTPPSKPTKAEPPTDSKVK